VAGFFMLMQKMQGTGFICASGAHGFKSHSRYRACYASGGLFYANAKNAGTGQVMRLWRTWVQCSIGAHSPILATKPVMKMAGVFILVITRSIIPLYFLYHLPCLSGIYRKYFT
jgi:hypothetical protein